MNEQPWACPLCGATAPNGGVKAAHVALNHPDSIDDILGSSAAAIETMVAFLDELYTTWDTPRRLGGIGPGYPGEDLS